jgi:hypothetical protein
MGLGCGEPLPGRRERRIDLAVVGVQDDRGHVAPVHGRVDRDQVTVGDNVVDVVVQVGERRPQP